MGLLIWSGCVQNLDSFHLASADLLIVSEECFLICLLGVLVLQKSLKLLFCASLEVEPGSSPKASTVSWLLPPCLCIPPLPCLATRWTCPLEGQEAEQTGSHAQEPYRVLLSFRSSIWVSEPWCQSWGSSIPGWTTCLVTFFISIHFLCFPAETHLILCGPCHHLELFHLWNSCCRHPVLDHGLLSYSQLVSSYLSEPPDQLCPIELSVMIEMFFIDALSPIQGNRGTEI